MRRGAPISSYGLAWAGIILLLAVGVLWLLFRAPTTRKGPLPLNEIKLEASELDKGSEAEQSIDEQAAALQLGLEDAELSIASPDGTLKMQLWADMASKDAGQYRIKSGAVLFSAKDQPSILIKVSDGSFTRESGRARVKGTLTGWIDSGAQYFTAKELSWDRSSERVTASEVRYVGPNFDVAGAQMTIDLTTKEVRFDGEVELGV